MRFPPACFTLGLFLFLAAPAWAQTNDSFAARLPLTGLAATAVSNNLHATREAGEPNYAGTAGARSLWWTWTAPADGTINFSTFGGGTASSQAGTNVAARSLAVYTGDTLAGLSEVASATTLNLGPGGYPQANGVPVVPSLNVGVTAGTAYQIAVDGAAVQALADDGTVVLSINQAPAIYSPAGAVGTVGVAFTYTVQASNNPTSFDANGLPPGLSINPYSGDVTGTPTAAGVYNVQLSATNPGGKCAGTLNLVVGNATVASVAAPTAPVFSNSAGTSGTVGGAFSYSLSASGSPTSYGASGLPAGLTLDVTNGQISGTPTAAGVFDVPVTARNAAGTGHATVSINIAAGPSRPVITSALAAVGTVGVSFYYTVSTNSFSGVGSPTSYGASNLPPGLGIDTVSGTVQGAPTTAGVYTVPISATNVTGTGSAVLTITVAAGAAPPQAAPPLLTSSAVASGAAGTAFVYGLTASNAPTGFTADNLPPGLGVNAQTGYIAGTPSNTGVFLVPVTATNAYGTCPATLTITIAAASPTSANGSLIHTSGSTTPPVITSAAAAGGYVGQGLSYQIYPPYYAFYGSSGAAVYRASNLPPGTSLDATAGYIYGTPTAAGVYSVPVSVSVPYSAYYSNGGNTTQYTTGSAVVTFIIGANSPPVSAAPVVTSAATSTTAVVGSAFSGYTIAASNSPTGFTATNLPPGLTLNTTSGAITGTPTTAGTYAVAVTAVNGIGTGNATVTFTVAATAAATPAPVISSSAIASATVGSSFSYSISASNSPTSYTADNLPPGLSLDASGSISGTPTTAGVYAVPVSASNASGTTNATLTITVAAQAAPIISGYSTARGVVGSSLYYYISGTQSPTSYTADNLPPGLSLSTSGTISGTPTAAGVFNVTVTATNSVGTGSATVIFTIAATANTPTLAGSAVASGTVGTAFSYTISASNAPTGYTATNLPPGLSVSATGGTISGTPTTAGVYTVPVSASNASGTANAKLTVTIAAGAAASAPVVTSAAAASGVVNAAFSYTITATGAPTSFDLGASAPPGLSFNPNTGTLSGTPTTAGVYTVPVSATNAVGTGRAKITLTFAAQPSDAPIISSAAGANLYIGDPFTYTITGTNSPTSFTASPLPAGLTLNPATGVISGTPTGSSSSTMMVTATNGVGQGTAILTLSVVSAPGRFTSPLSASGVKDTAFTYTTTTNTSASSFSGSNLPPGLTINYSTGKVSGTPTVSGTYNATLSGYASSGTQLSAQVTFVITAAAGSTPPVLSSSAGASGIVGDPFSYTLTATNNPTTRTVGGLPGGLSYNAATGVISGTPTGSGSFSVPLSATNAAGTTSGTLRVVIFNGPARVTSPAGASAAVGVPFNYQTTVNVGTLYYFSTYSLPPGLSYGSTGAITGTPTQAGTYTVSLSGYTSQGSSFSASLSITVAATPATPPLVTSAAAAAGAVSAPFSYTIAASNGPTGYSASNLPAGLAFDPAMGSFSGRPTAGGTFYVPVTATNAAGTSNATLTFVVASAPPAPKLDATSLTASANAGTFTILTLVQAANTTVASYTASGLPPGLSLDPTSGNVSGTPTTEGTYAVAVSATNGTGSASAVVTLTVNHGIAPVFSYNTATVSGNVGTPVSQYLRVSNGATSFTASGLPPGLYLDAGTGCLRGVPTAAGTYSVALTASNAAGSDNEVLTLLVGNGIAPTFSSASAAATGRVGGSFSYSFFVNNATRCAVSGLPPGLSYSISSGSFGSIKGSPTAAGVYPATITLTNAAGTSHAVATLTITDAASAAPPVISSAAGGAGYVGAGFGSYLSASNSPTSYAASGLPDGLQISPTSGYIYGTPTTAGSYPVNVSATNAGGTGSAVVTLRIEGSAPAAGSVPIISSAASVNLSGSSSSTVYYYYGASPYGSTYTITASGNPTRFGASHLPAGLSVNPYSGIISGKLLTAGTFTVPISATNAAGTGTATLTIIAPATPPTLAPTLTVGGVVGNAFAYSIAHDADSVFNYYPFTSAVPETTVYGAAGLPPGLSVNTATGDITGTPTQAGSFPVTLSETTRAGTVGVVLTFVIAATPPPVSAPPALSNAATAAGIAGTPLNFRLSASNAPTRYGAGSLPAGLGLDPATGTITGTPTTAGVYAAAVSAMNGFGTANATLTFAIAAPGVPVINSRAGAQATVGTVFNYLVSSAVMDSTSGASSYGVEALPDGLSLDAGTGRITGVPTTTGEFTVPISATSAGVTGHATLTLSVLPATASPAAQSAPVFRGLVGTVGFTGNPFVYDLGTGGFAPDGALPEGLVYDAARGMISGYPTATGSFDVPVSATNGVGTGHGVLSLRLAAPDLSLPRVALQPAGQTVAQGGSAALTTAVTGAPTPVLQWVHDGVAMPGATGAELDFMPVQPAQAGTYVLTASNSSGSVTSVAAVLRVLQTYGGWQSRYFSAEEIAAGKAAGGFDFDGDGLTNFIEYALGSDPRTGTGGGVLAVSRGGGGALQMQFDRDSGKTDLDYVVEASSDLKVWTAIARSTAGGATNNLGGAGAVTENAAGGGIVTVTVQDGAAPAGGGARFLRLRVTGL